jgi:hypothetical protein
MKNLTSHKVRSLFLLSGVTAMMGATLMVPQAAHADKAQNYKIGATALGVLGVVLAAKGKTGPALLAGAGAYYAYEKGKDAEQDEWYDNRYDRYDHYDYNYRDYNYRNDHYYDNGRYDRYDNHNRYDGRNDNWHDNHSRFGH